MNIHIHARRSCGGADRERCGLDFQSILVVGIEHTVLGNTTV